MTTAQMETMVRVAFVRIFGREPDETHGDQNEQGHTLAYAIGAAPYCRPNVSVTRAPDGMCYADIDAPEGVDVLGVSRMHQSPAAALRYAEAAYRRSIPPG